MTYELCAARLAYRQRDHFNLWDGPLIYPRFLGAWQDVADPCRSAMQQFGLLPGPWHGQGLPLYLQRDPTVEEAAQFSV